MLTLQSLLNLQILFLATLKSFHDTFPAVDYGWGRGSAD